MAFDFFTISGRTERDLFIDRLVKLFLGAPTQHIHMYLKTNHTMLMSGEGPANFSH